MTVNEIITNTIINKLKDAEKSGKTYYWVKPFSIGSPEKAYSYDNSVAYTGINRLLLDADEYLTFNKISELSLNSEKPYKIRTGAKANIVIYYNTTALKDKETGELILDEDTGKPIVKGFLRYYKVFSRQDVIDDEGNNLPSKFNFKHYNHDDINKQMKTSLNRFHKLINHYCKKYNIHVEIINDGTEAYFMPTKNTIRFPNIENFKSLYEYMHTIAHEIIHSTMIPLERQTSNERELKKIIESYSKEELVAEIGAEMILQNLKIPDDRQFKENSIAYLQGWTNYLQDKPKQLISAAAQAETASDFVLNIEQKINKIKEVEER